MWEGSYENEPFDLRLTALRLVRSADKILLITLIGSLLFGGSYYVKNVLLAEKLYTATITCKIEYTDPPSKSGDYCINGATWNTYVDSAEFLGMLMMTEPVIRMDSAFTLGGEGLKDLISADVASDIHVPSFTVMSDTENRTELLEQAVAEVVTGPWAERLPEVASIEVIDMGSVHPFVDRFVRPVRAFVFGAVLTCFFAVILFLLREIGADSIWLPATLRSRYGLMAVGTAESGELAENIRYAFGEKNGFLRSIALCPADDSIDPQEVLGALQEKGVCGEDREWVPVPAPILSPESARELRRAEGMLLVVSAGLHAGKPLEHTLEFLREQDVKITGVLLWKADEKLLRAYYLLQKEGQR